MENREWQEKWRNFVPNNTFNWTQIWQDIHNKTNNPYVQSSVWELIYLNFWSAYRAGENCKLCGEIELDHTHIISDCAILKEILKRFKLNVIFNKKPKISFGLDNDYFKIIILFHIKSAVFRSRFYTYCSIEQCIISLINKCKDNITKDLKYRYDLAKVKGNIEDFLNKYNINNSLRSETMRICSLNDQNELYLLI